MIDADRLEQIDRVLADVVKPARWPQTRAVDIEANHLRGEPVPYADAVAGDFVPFAEGEPWGPDWDTTWFHVTGSIPPEWAGCDTILIVHLGYGGGTGFGAEGQVWVEGEPLHGISPNHREVLVAAPSEGGETVDLYIEAAANPPAPALDPGRLLLADPGGEPRLTLRRCHLAVVDREVEGLVRDWVLVREMGTWLGGERSASCNAALDAACRVIEQHTLGGATVDEARSVLATALAAPGRSTGRTHLAAGNSHLDTAWLWPLRETRRKAARTFSTAVTMLEREPDYRFAASQAQQFEWIRDAYPSLWQRLRAQVAAGRFGLVGSTWVEPDCNIPSGESLVRQIVHGKRFFREEFGIDSPGLWLPDTFGYSAALPQILADAGIDWFMTQKISWNEVNRFPHHTFWWEGIDGTRVFTHLPPADTYTGDLSVPNLLHGERNFNQADTLDLSLYLYGHGDGGGGPDTDMLERARRLADVDGIGRVELTGAAEAMERIRAEGESADLPVWVGELYLEKHRGTYTTHGEVKRANRELEGALRESELWAAAASSLVGLEIPIVELDRAWKAVLLHQFHDIIPGSSIHWVYDDTLADYATVRSTTAQIRDRSLAAIASRVDTADARRPVLVANSLGWARAEVVEVDGELHQVAVPPCGWAVNDLSVPGDATPVTVGDGWMANGELRVEWSDSGLIRSVRHLRSGREAIAAGRAGNVLQLMEDRPAEWDAWDIDRAAFDSAVDLVDAVSVELVEHTDMRATLRVVREFGASQIQQLIRLTCGSRRVEFDCTADWHEDHKLLKVAFPVDVRASSATHEIQFGHVERATHRNTSWDEARFETCAQTWVDLSDDGFGVALLNDSKYGHDVLGNVIRLSLLRSPTWPDPLADRGRHRFGFALYPHQGRPTDGGVIREAHCFNTPLRVVALDSIGDSVSLPARHSVVEPDDPGIVVSAVKPADDGDGTIVRLYEAHGGRREVGITVPGATEVERVDVLERAKAGPTPLLADERVELLLRPFELVTLRVR